MKPCLFYLLICSVLITSCGKTIFYATVDNEPIGGFPNTNQKVGTVKFSVHDSVRIAKITGLPGKWIKLGRSFPESDVVSLQCKVDTMRGDKAYQFSTYLFLDNQSPTSSISFEAFNQPMSELQGFLHIDLLPDNKLRVNDDANKTFGSFPRNQPFILSVSFNTITNNPTAHISLSGAGASGTFDTPLLNFGPSNYHRFGQVRFWMGWPHIGKFNATNILVKYK